MPLARSSRLLVVATMGTLAAAASILPRTALAGPVSVNADLSDPHAREAFEAVAARFAAANPETKLELRFFNRAQYKTAIGGWLAGSPPDIVFLHTGIAMRQFIAAGQLADETSLFTPAMRQAFGTELVRSVSSRGGIFAVPYSQYQHGLYYRADLFAKAGIGPIRDWSDLLSACDRLRKIGIIPIAIGTKDVWQTASWFDTLDLRINGAASHRRLMSGGMSYLDPALHPVFAHWRHLLDHRCFPANHAELAWSETRALLVGGQAGMMLTANFVTAGVPPEQLAPIDYMEFPPIVAGRAMAEDVPTSVLAIPAGVSNRPGAERFLRFVMQPGTQALINRIEGQIPANRDAVLLDNRFLAAGRTVLESKIERADFFDRDTDPAVAEVAMTGFRRFMLQPDRLAEILASIERARRAWVR